MYHLFGFDCYEGRGGLNDYLGGFDSMETAKARAEKFDFEYYHVAKERDGKLISIAQAEGEYENNNPGVTPAPKGWDWGKFIIKWEQEDIVIVKMPEQ